MKNKLQSGVFFICVASLFFCGEARAQADPSSAWQPIYLTAGGSNTVDGVQAMFQLNKCNDEDVVFVKFINRNTRAVTIEWYDAVLTQEKKWINRENAADKKTLSIPANSDVTGDCLGNNSLVVVKVKGFVSTAEMFIRYSASQFSISPE